MSVLNLTKAFTILVLMLLFSCGDKSAPYLHYRADFNKSKIQQTELLVHEIGKRWNLDIVEKDKETLRYVQDENDVFFMTMKFDEDPIIAVTNHGVAEILTIHVADYGKMPIKKLESLSDDIVTTLETKLGITFVSQNMGRKS